MGTISPKTNPMYHERRTNFLSYINLIETKVLGRKMCCPPQIPVVTMDDWGIPHTHTQNVCCNIPQNYMYDRKYPSPPPHPPVISALPFSMIIYLIWNYFHIENNRAWENRETYSNNWAVVLKCWVETWSGQVQPGP